MAFYSSWDFIIVITLLHVYEKRSGINARRMAKRITYMGRKVMYHPPGGKGGRWTRGERGATIYSVPCALARKAGSSILFKKKIGLVKI